MCQECDNYVETSSEEQARIRVAAGVKYFDELVPQWRRLIDLYMLDISSVTMCIVGQIYAEYADNDRFMYQPDCGPDCCPEKTYFSGYNYWFIMVNGENHERAVELGLCPGWVDDVYVDRQDLTVAWKQAIRNS